MKKVVSGLIVCFTLLAIFGCSKNNEIYEKMMEQGLLQIEKEEYASAENFFEKALDQKPKDKKATKLIKQTKQMIKAQKEFDEGDFEAAKSSAEKVEKVEDGSEALQEKAKSLIGQMEKMEKEKEEYTASFDEAKQHHEQGEFDDSLGILDKVLENDLGHPFFSELKEEIDTLKGEVKDAKEIALAEAKAKAEAEAKAKAEAEAKAAAEKAEKDRKAAEEKAKQKAQSKDIGAAGGYWLTEDRTEACHLTSTYLACAVKQSDVIFKNDISNINHISSTEIELTFSFGHKSRITLSGNNVLQGESGRMNRVSKEEANSIYDGYYELP
ncbi:lipoprotein [Bacillus freudenreichii]|nr:lipoprotein [Bacillus freudenreichii]